MPSSKIRGGIAQTEESIVLKSGASTQLTITHPANNTAARVLTLPDEDAAYSLVGALHGGDATKAIVWDSSGATTAKKLTLDTNHTDNRTLTLPDATDTLLGRATTDTLTNKTIDSGSNTITLATSTVTSGTFADARISESSITQHVAAIDHDSLLNFVANEHIDWTSASTALVTTAAITGQDFQATGSGANQLPSGATGSRPGAPADGMIRWNTTLGDVEVYNSGWALLGANAADRQLSNLTGTTAIPVSLLPSAGGINIGSTSDPWNSFLGTSFSGVVSGATEARVFASGAGLSDKSGMVSFSGNSTFESLVSGSHIYLRSDDRSDSGDTGSLAIASGQHTGAGANDTGDIIIATGLVSNGSASGNTGDITLTTGTVAGSATRGSIKIVDGSEGTSGHYVVSDATDGSITFEEKEKASTSLTVTDNRSGTATTYSATYARSGPILYFWVDGSSFSNTDTSTDNFLLDITGALSLTISTVGSTKPVATGYVSKTAGAADGSQASAHVIAVRGSGTELILRLVDAGSSQTSTSLDRDEFGSGGSSTGPEITNLYLHGFVPIDEWS